MRYYAILIEREYILCAHSSKRVDVYEMAGLQKISTMKTMMDIGIDGRMAVSDKNKMACCADYYKGIAAYDIFTGKEIWKNKKIKEIQTILLSDEQVFVHTEKNRLYILSSASGEELHIEKNVLNIYRCGTSDLVLFLTNKGFETMKVTEGKVSTQPIERIKAGEFFHTAAFFDDKLYIFNNGDSFESYSPGGSLLWVSDVEKGYIINSIRCNTSSGFLCCLSLYNNGKRMDSYVIDIEVSSGKVFNKFSLGAEVISAGISRDGSLIVGSNGLIWDARSGEVLNRLGE